MDRVGSLLLTVLIISASSSIVQAKVTRYWIHFHETVEESDIQILKPLSPDPPQNAGFGWTKHNNAVNTTDGSVLGWVGGMYFFHSTDAIEDIVTITFSTNLTGIWSGSSLNLRGWWKMNANGTADLDKQELSIVGGQGGFRGASGSVYYERIEWKVFLVTCDIFIDDLKYRMPKTQPSGKFIGPDTES